MVEKIGRMRAFACKRIKDFSSNCDGSEAVEMVYNMVALVFLVLSTLLIIGYALQMNQVSYAAQRIARAVEVSGEAKQTEIDRLLYELLPNADDIDARLTVSADDWVDVSEATIQLRDQFTVNVSANYHVTLINPGFGDPMDPWSIPIRVKVNGQSEIYWKT